MTLIAANTSRVGNVQDTWLSQVKPDIEARMAQYAEGQIEFAILGLVRDPLLDLVPRLAANMKAILALTRRLEQTNPDWRRFTFMDDEASLPLTAPDTTYCITEEDILLAHLPNGTATLCSSNDIEQIVAQRQQLIAAQASLRQSIREEQQSNQSDHDRVDARSCDYATRLQNFVRKVKTKRHALDSATTATNAANATVAAA